MVASVDKTIDGDRRELERVLAILRRSWWVIVLVTVLVAGATFAFSKLQRKQYSATASILFQPSQVDQLASQLASGVQGSVNTPAADPTFPMATNVQLLSEQSGLAAATARAIGRGVTRGEVASAIRVSGQGQTDVVLVSATTLSPSLSAAIANAYVQEFLAEQDAQQRAAVQQALGLVNEHVHAQSPQQLAGPTGQALLNRAESLRILSQLPNRNAQSLAVATPPSAPSSPKVTRNTALGLLIGLLLGLGVAFLRQRLDRRMKTVEDLEQFYGLPLLAAVPYSRSYALAPQSDVNGDHGEHEVFRMLRTYLRYFNQDRKIKTLLVVSAAPRDGKTTVARNLAQAAQEIGTRTLLIEANLRHPDLARLYGVEPAPGLSELLARAAEPSEATRAIFLKMRVNGTTSEVALHVVLAGHPPPNPAELIDSRAMDAVLADAAESYELVVIDTPPLSVVSDAMPLLSKVDGVVVVSRLGNNTRDAAAFLKNRLTGVNAPLLGVVANGVGPKGGYGYGYGYYGQTETTQTGDAAHPPPRRPGEGGTRGAWPRLRRPCVPTPLPFAGSLLPDLHHDSAALAPETSGQEQSARRGA